MLYGVKNLFTHRPTEISLAVVAFLNTLVAFNALDITPTQVGQVNTLTIIVLGLFIKANTSTNVAVNELQTATDDAHAAGVNQAVQAVVDAFPAPVAPEPEPAPLEDPPEPEPVAPPPAPAKKTAAAKKAAAKRAAARPRRG